MIDRGTVLADIARILEVDIDELELDASLVDQGLDSVRLMALVEHWRQAGADIDFVSLASDPDLEQWCRMLAA